MRKSEFSERFVWAILLFGFMAAMIMGYTLKTILSPADVIQEERAEEPLVPSTTVPQPSVEVQQEEAVDEIEEAMVPENEFASRLNAQVNLNELFIAQEMFFDVNGRYSTVSSVWGGHPTRP